MKFYDRLYGVIELDPRLDGVVQTPQFQRLKKKSLSVVPAWWLQTGVCSDKFEHSVGVAYLAQLVTENLGWDTDFVLAALLHDIGTPPFSHGGEIYQEWLTGMDHEAYAWVWLNQGELYEEIRKLGGDPDKIATMIRGDDHHVGAWVSGSIDVDNLDNSLRFGLSMGLFQERDYDPTILARAMHLQHNEPVMILDEPSHIEGWHQCRRRVYEFVYSPDNLAAAAMLTRAMDFAYEAHELPEPFFRMNDYEGYMHLRDQTNSKTRKLIHQLNNWQFFSQEFAHETTKPSEAFLEAAGDFSYRGVLADEIAAILGVGREQVGVFIRIDKGHVDIEVPVIAQEGKELTYTAPEKPRYMAQVYVHPDVVPMTDEIDEFMEERLELV